jgi:hypothetical protein
MLLRLVLPGINLVIYFLDRRPSSSRSVVPVLGHFSRSVAFEFPGVMAFTLLDRASAAELLGDLLVRASVVLRAAGAWHRA